MDYSAWSSTSHPWREGPAQLRRRPQGPEAPRKGSPHVGVTCGASQAGGEKPGSKDPNPCAAWGLEDKTGYWANRAG